MTTPDNQPTPDVPPGFTHAYCIELLYESAPNFPRWMLDEAIKARVADVDPFGGDQPEGPWIYGHLGHTIRFKEGAVPPQTVVTPGAGSTDPAAIEAALQHTYDWPGARDAVARAKASVMVNDLLASTLPHPARLNLIESILLCVCDVAPPLAIHWIPSGKIVDPAALRRHLAPGPDFTPLHGALNVRIFRIAGSDDDTLMDTMGLAALGVPDLQCHFRHLDPNRVATQLFNYAHYLFAKGDVIDDGHTVQGTSPDEKWTVRHELSLLEPQRLVLDLNPGAPYAAGNRD